MVVDATTNGAVPVVTFDSNVEATTLPAVLKLPALTLTVTVKSTRVPTLVIFGCDASVTSAAKAAKLAFEILPLMLPVMLPPGMLVNPAPLP